MTDRRGLLLAMLLLAACGSKHDAIDLVDAALPDAGDHTDAATDAAADAAVDAAADAGPVCPGVGCSGVDILFVVDNSISMSSAQQQLLRAFPAFYQQIVTTLADTDFHLLVVDTDATGNENVCERLCPNLPPGAILDGNQGVCAYYPCGAVRERDLCDATLGGGSVFPIGTGGSNRDCGFPEGRRYLSSTDENLEELFLCSAAVGTFGDGNERPVGAMLSALESETQPGGCVEGFLRPEALLVVVIISDAGSTAAELDNASVAGWHDRLRALKCDQDNGVVMVTISHDGDEVAPWYSSLFWQGDNDWRNYCQLTPDECCCPMIPDFPDGPRDVCPECAGTSPPWEQCWFYFTGYGVPLRRLSDSFGPRGMHREICSDFDGVLTDALELITNACDIF